MRGFNIGMAEVVKEIREMTREQLELRQRELNAKILQVRMDQHKHHAAEAVAVNCIRHRRYYG